MLFKAKQKVNIKQPDGIFVSLSVGDEIELPQKYAIHSALEVVESKPIKKAPKKKVSKKKAK